MKTLIISKETSDFESDALYAFMRALIRPGDEIVLRARTPHPASEERSHFPQALADIDNFDRLVIAGDDQMSAEILFLLRGHAIPILIFPAGVENLFFDATGNAAEPAALAKACQEGHTILSDLAQISWKDPHDTIHTQAFSCMAGFGFDATLLKAAIPNKKIMGPFAYFFAALTIQKPPSALFDITIDNNTFQTEGIACLVANASMIGGDIEIVSGTKINDGIMDVIVLQGADGKSLIRPYLRGLIDHRGQNLSRPEIEHFQGVEISVKSSIALPLQINGLPTTYEVDRYKARILAHANRIIVDGLSDYASARDSAPEAHESPAQ